MKELCTFVFIYEGPMPTREDEGDPMLFEFGDTPRVGERIEIMTWDSQIEQTCVIEKVTHCCSPSEKLQHKAGLDVYTAATYVYARIIANGWII